jgi:hypothetical protein
MGLRMARRILALAGEHQHSRFLAMLAKTDASLRVVHWGEPLWARGTGVMLVRVEAPVPGKHHNDIVTIIERGVNAIGATFYGMVERQHGETRTFEFYVNTIGTKVG